MAGASRPPVTADGEPQLRPRCADRASHGTLQRTGEIAMVDLRCAHVPYGVARLPQGLIRER